MEIATAIDLARPWSDWSEYEGLMGPDNTPYKAVMLSGEEDGEIHCLDIINHNDICSLKRYQQEGSGTHEVILQTDAEKLGFLKQIGGWLKAEDAGALEAVICEVLAFQLVPVKLEAYIRSRPSGL